MNFWGLALGKNHKDQSKERRFHGRLRRKVATREVRQRFLVVCEGERTEPAYFEAFQVPGLVVRVEGVGVSNLRLIEEARHKQARDDYDQVWCVFDRDDCEVDHIHRAIEQAQLLGYGIAFSNQAFELWYLLHFHYQWTAMSRSDYCERLSKCLGDEYQKNRPGIYLQLESRQEAALRNAQRLYEQYDPWEPASSDPSTTVHWLVEELNKHRRP
ncbi:MAG: RloB domain-containing protein [Chloroflexaceae bacterium]|nr:RloB domain-containing protein [Chloroflexaceae bacterium]